MPLSSMSNCCCCCTHVKKALLPDCCAHANFALQVKLIFCFNLLWSIGWFLYERLTTRQHKATGGKRVNPNFENKRMNLLTLLTGCGNNSDQLLQLRIIRMICCNCCNTWLNFEYLLAYTTILHNVSQSRHYDSVRKLFPRLVPKRYSHFVNSWHNLRYLK